MSIAEKLTKVAQNVPKVYAAGQKSEYDKFWDTFQDYGNRTKYDYAFARDWTAETFKPKYDIKPATADYMFYGNKMKNIKKAMEDAGVVLDTSATTNMGYFASSCQSIELPVISLEAATRVDGAFGWNDKLQTIEKLIVSEITSFTNMFNQTTALINLTIEGLIEKTGFNVQWSTKLTAASLLSILTALSKDNTVASGKSVTFAKVHQAVIEGNTECLEQYNLALSAGWSIAFA